MQNLVARCRRCTAVMGAATVLHACGGGGAAPPSAPSLPTGTGTPPSSPPSRPAQPPPSTPATPTPPPASAPSTPSAVTIRTPNRTFSPSTVTVALNGTVTWHADDERHTIVFTSAAPPAGSPGDVEEGTSASRTFTAAGTYEYECLRHRDKGMRGKVVVEAPPAQQPPPNAPASGSVTVTTPSATFNPSDVTISTGGSVTWQFSEARHNVTFQGPSPAGGNIPDQDPGTSASRTFTVPGTYSYVCTRHSGMAGRVVVQ
jgi:plastocyanin